MAEHVLGKDEVTRSIRVVGSIVRFVRLGSLSAAGEPEYTVRVLGNSGNKGKGKNKEKHSKELKNNKSDKEDKDDEDATKEEGELVAENMAALIYLVDKYGL